MGYGRKDMRRDGSSDGLLASQIVEPRAGQIIDVV